MSRQYLVLAIAVLVAACSQRVGDLTLASTKNLGSPFTPIRQAVRGQDCAESVLFIPWGSLVPNVEEAVDNAVSKAPGGDMMVNAVVHNDILITILYNRNCIRVDGDVVNSSPKP